MMRARGYSNGRSLGRILDHIAITRRFRRLARTQPAPDVIVASMPTPGLCRAAVDYGRENNVPVVLDMRDMWPDIFADAVPRLARPLARCLLFPMLRRARAACATSTGWS